MDGGADPDGWSDQTVRAAHGGAECIAIRTFGREYTDRTVKDLLALPVSRGRIVWAKLVSALIWCFVMTMATYGFAVLTGVLFRMPGLTMDVAQHYFVQLLIICGMQLLLCGPVVFTASASRGYLAPIGFAFSTLMVALVVGPTPLGAWLPWSVPALQLAGSGSAVFPLSPASYMAPVAVGLLGIAGTWGWWRRADQR